QNNYDSWMQRDHIRAESHKHLRSSLSADAAIDIGLARKEAAELRILPRVSNGVAHKDDPRFVLLRRRQLCISIMIAGQRRPIFETCLCSRELCLYLGAF